MVGVAVVCGCCRNYFAFIARDGGPYVCHVFMESKVREMHYLLSGFYLQNL